MMKKWTCAALAFLLLCACAHAEILPGWQADPMEYNSCTDIYSDNAVLVGDYVYDLEMYTTKDEVGKVLLRWEYDTPENTVVLRDLGLWNSQFLLDAGDGLLVTDVDRGKVFWMDYEGQNERLLFYTQENRPAFEFLVGDRLYYESNNSIYYYSFDDGETHLLCDGKIKEDLAWNDMDAIFAGGKIYMSITQRGLYAVDVFTGEVQTYHDTVPAPVIEACYFDGWLYVLGAGSYGMRVDPETSATEELKNLPNAWPDRVIGNYVHIQENSWGFDSTDSISGWYEIPPEGFGDFSFVTEENRRDGGYIVLGEKMFNLNYDVKAEGSDIGRTLTSNDFPSYTGIYIFELFE